MKNISIYRKWLPALLFAITMMIPKEAWAATHYDAGYAGVSATYNASGMTITVDDVRIYNYQGNNSHWWGAPTVTLNVNGTTGTFTFANLVSYSSANDNFYYQGEGNENPYKSGFNSSTYTGTINGCSVSASFSDKKYNQTIGGIQHWCTADLVITVATQGYVTASLSGKWRDASDGVNNNQESVSWSWGTFQHTHQFGSYSYNNNASYTVAGTKTRTCAYCNHSETIADSDHPKWTYSVTSQNTSYGTVSAVPDNGSGKKLTLTASPATYYQFSYWQIGSQQISTNPYTYTGTGNMSAKGYFIPTATITFNANGGSGTMAQQQIKSSGTLTANSFTRDNHVFVGWRTEANGGSYYSNKSVIRLSDDLKGPITLYAWWAPVGNTVWRYTAATKVDPNNADNLKDANGQTLSFTNACDSETKDGVYVFDGALTEIGSAAFYNCKGLSGSITIPRSVTSIGNSAFGECTNIQSITMYSIPGVGTDAFASVTCSKTLKLDDDSYVFTGSNENFPELTSNPTYTHSMPAGSQWGTVVLPFKAVSNNDVQLYLLTGMAATTLTPAANVEANTPCVFKKKTSGATSVTFTAAGKVVSPNTPATPAASAVEGISLTGTYAGTSVAAGAGYVLDDAGSFTLTSAETGVAPFGAYLQGSIADIDAIILHLEHLYNEQKDTEDYLAVAATCTNDEEYYHKCSLCLAKGTTKWVKSGTTLPHDLVHFVCKDCGAQPATVASGTLEWDKDYKRTSSCTVADFTFTRAFVDTNWQTWYEPFELTPASDNVEGYEFARINNVHQYEDENGDIDEMVVECFRVTGKLRANYPYIVKRVNGAGTLTVQQQNAALQSAAETNIVCESMDNTYTFTGNYQAESMSSVYTLETGAWTAASAVAPQTHYLTITPRSGSHSSSNAAPSRISLVIIGEEDANGIVTLYPETMRQVESYSLSGYRLSSENKGLQIKNGKTRFIK